MAKEVTTLKNANSISSFIIDKLEATPYAKNLMWLAKETDMNYDTLRSQLRGGNVRVEFMVKASIILGFDLNELKDIYKDMKEEYRWVNSNKFLRKAKNEAGEEVFQLLLQLVKNDKEELAEKLLRIDYDLCWINLQIKEFEAYGVEPTYSTIEKYMHLNSVLLDEIQEEGKAVTYMKEFYEKISKRYQKLFSEKQSEGDIDVSVN